MYRMVGLLLVCMHMACYGAAKAVAFVPASITCTESRSEDGLPQRVTYWVQLTNGKWVYACATWCQKAGNNGSWESSAKLYYPSRKHLSRRLERPEKFVIGLKHLYEKQQENVAQQAVRKEALLLAVAQAHQQLARERQPLEQARRLR